MVISNLKLSSILPETITYWFNCSIMEFHIPLKTDCHVFPENTLLLKYCGPVDCILHISPPQGKTQVDTKYLCSTHSPFSWKIKLPSLEDVIGMSNLIHGVYFWILAAEMVAAWQLCFETASACILHLPVTPTPEKTCHLKNVGFSCSFVYLTYVFPAPPTSSQLTYL